MTDDLVRKPKGRYLIPIGLLIVIMFIGTLILGLTLIPQPSFKVVGNASICLSGASGQNSTNITQIAVNPYGQLVDAILVEGTLYEKVWDESTNDFLLKPLPEEKYDNLFLSIKDFQGKTSYHIGHFTNKSIYINRLNTDLLPLSGDLLMEFIFEYRFPSVSCSCQSKNYSYVFQPVIAFGYET